MQAYFLPHVFNISNTLNHYKSVIITFVTTIGQYAVTYHTTPN